MRFSQLPNSTRLFASFVEDFPAVRGYYAYAPDESGLLAAAREARLPEATRREVVRVLEEQNQAFGADAAARRNLDRLAAGAVAVVTGQQVSLFSGPAYTFYKALTANHCAHWLTERGIDAVPVFWLATEDHDLAEVNHCFWPTRAGATKLELTLPGHSQGRRVGEVRLGEGIRGLVESALASLAGPGCEEISKAIAESYRSEENFGTALGKLLARVLAGRGVIFFNPLDPRVHRLAAGIYRCAAESCQELTEALLQRNKELEGSGFHPQVKVTQQSTLLFCDVAGRRQPLRRRNGKFFAGNRYFSQEELLQAIEAAPEAFTPNVLLRPVIQDSLFPTAAYVAGPAEVAYFAQAQTTYMRLLGRMPAILPRASFTLVEPHIARLLKKYKLSFKDLLRGRQFISQRMAREFLPPVLGRRFTRDEKALRRMLSNLRAPLRRLDSTLVGALDTAERKMVYQFLKLRSKAGRAEGFRTGVLSRDEQMLCDFLYPHRNLQERTLCLLPFLAQHGSELLDRLAQSISVAPRQHQVLFL